MKKRITTSCAILSACALLAEPVWLATVDVDSLQTLQSGIESFSKAAELPVPPEMLASVSSELLKGMLPLQSLDAAISNKDPIRIFVVGDSEASDAAPALIFTMTLSDNAKALQDELGEAYSTRRADGNVTTFSGPQPDSPLPANMLLVNVDRNKALLITSRAAHAWLQKQTKLDAFLPIPGNQTLKVCIDVKQAVNLMQDLAGGQPNPALAMLGDIEYLSLAVNPNAQALSISYGVRPKAGSPLAALLDTAKPLVDAALWNAIPENAFFTYIGAKPQVEDSQKFIKAYLQQDIPIDPMQVKLEKTITSEIVHYLVPTADKKSLRAISINAVKDAAAAKELIKTLDQAEPGNGIKIKKMETRELGQQTIERYSIEFDMTAFAQQAGQGADPNLTMAGTFMALFAKSIITEYTVKDNYLLSATSPASATDNWIPAIPFAAPTVTLDKKLTAFDPTAKPLLGAVEFRLMPFLKHAISMVPNVKPEHINLFGAATDAIQCWSIRTADNKTVATVRLPANEVAALVKLGTTGQATLQELFFTLFAGQMQQLMVPPAAVPPPNF